MSTWMSCSSSHVVPKPHSQLFKGQWISRNRVAQSFEEELLRSKGNGPHLGRYSLDNWND